MTTFSILVVVALALVIGFVAGWLARDGKLDMTLSIIA